jgi:transporter family-2 protein
VAIALAVAAGLAGAVQAAVMGELGGRAGIFPALAFSGVVAVVIGLALLLVAKQSLRGLGDVARQPLWLWTGAALIDRCGWFGFDQITITWTRALGLVLLGAGAALSLFERS